jgi:hypothetical protein
MLQLLCTSPEHNLPTSHFSSFPSSISITSSTQSSPVKGEGSGEGRSIAQDRPASLRLLRPDKSGPATTIPIEPKGISVGVVVKKVLERRLFFIFEFTIVFFMFFEKAGCGAARSEPWPAIPSSLRERSGRHQHPFPETRLPPPLPAPAREQ